MELLELLDTLDVEFEDGELVVSRDDQGLTDQDLNALGVSIELADDFPRGSAWYLAVANDGDEAWYYPGQGWE
jgi:hypothetical protein